MRLLSNKVIKNYKVCMGTPFRVKIPGDIVENYDKSADVYSANTFVMEERSVHYENSLNIEEIVQQAQREANIIIKEAEAEARRILEKSREDAKKGKKEIEEAKSKGYDDGYNEAKMQYESLIAEAKSIREEAIKEYKRILESAEADIVEIILNIARKVLQTEISQNREIIFNLVREAIDNCSYKNDIVLRLSPYEYDFIMKEKDEIDSILEDVENLEIKKDPSLKEGDCIAETPYGCVETSMQVKLNKIENAFRELYNFQDMSSQNLHAYTREES